MKEENHTLSEEEIEKIKIISKEGRERLQAGVAKLSLGFPLFCIPLLNLVKMESWSLKTMGVGPINKFDLALYYNPEFVLSLTPIELKAVLQHEALHILLQHLTRGASFSSNFKLFNIAADLTINPKLVGIPKWGYFPEKINLPKSESAELYYKLLKEKRDETLSKIKQRMKEQGMSDKEIEESFIDSLEGSLIDEHSLWDSMTEEEKNVITEKIRNLSEEAMSAQDKVGWGKLPGNLVGEIVAANKPIINWKRELRYFISQVIASGRKNTRLRPNRRYGYNQPGTKRNYTSRLLIAIDCSGSVSDKELQMFVDEINGMIGKVQCDIITFDAVCHGSPETFSKRRRSVKIHGRGGTNFEPPIRLADELKYDGLILMTDGECSFPPEPKCKMMWVLSRDSKWAGQPPYGKVIQLNQIS